MSYNASNLDFLIKPISFPQAQAQITDWQVLPLFNQKIGSFENFSSHISTLKPNALPHSPHSHIEAELIISLAGKIEIITFDQPDGSKRQTLLLEPGSFVYHSSGQIHTLCCIGKEAARYLVFKWRRYRHIGEEQGSFIYDECDQESAVQQVSKGFRLLPLDGLAKHTNGSLQAHLSVLEPGAGYPPHQDAYDIVAVLLAGKLETFNLPISAPAVFFFSANTPHGFSNPGSKPANYLVFEFNQPN
jgi:quercetin dioxygenase-like cupin family protein